MIAKRILGFTLSTVLCSGALPSLAQERLETLPGVLLVHSQNPQACLTVSDGASAFDEVLRQAAQSHPDLRAISFELDDVLEASRLIVEHQSADILTPNELAAEIARASRFTDWTAAQPEMTVHSFPDQTLVDDLGICPTEQSENAPEVAMSTARAWMMPVGGVSSAPTLGVPAEFETYLKALSEQKPEGSYLGTCMLLGGSLSMQPAYSNVLAGPALASIGQSLENFELESGLGVRLARGLFSPMPLKLRGWDVVLLADVLSAPPDDDLCFVLTERVLGVSGAELPVLGGNPTEAVEFCPEGGLKAEENLRLPLYFAQRSAALAEGDDVRIADAVRCAAASELDLEIRIEGYASQAGSLTRNRDFARQRATSVTNVVTATLEELGRCNDEEGCETVSLIGVGFSETAAFPPPDDTKTLADSNQIAILTLTPTEAPMPLMVDQRLTTAASQSFLALRPNATCQPAGDQPAARGQSLISFLTGEFGRDLITQLNMPSMVLVLHNQPDASDFADSLQEAAGKVASCENNGKPHIGYVYHRSGPNFEAGQVVSDEIRDDYFVLPPKLTWIYPLPDQNGGPDLTGLLEVTESYEIESENNVVFEIIANPVNVRERRRWLNQVDILHYNKPVPISDVLAALARVNAGTGWVNLTAGWD